MDVQNSTGLTSPHPQGEVRAFHSLLKTGAHALVATGERQQSSVRPDDFTSSRWVLSRRFCHLMLISLLAGAASVAVSWRSSHAQGVGLELVDPKVLRVCADPSNLPFSNDKGEGFENKFAELLAQKLDKRIA